MTAAGSARVAYRAESSFNNANTNNDWIQPGINVSVSDFSIENNQTRNRQPDDVTPDGSRVGNFSGTLSLNWTLTDDNFHELLPFDGGSNNLSGTGGAAPTAEWYLETNALDDSGSAFSEDVTVSGAITEATIEYTEGEPISVDVTVDFGALSDNSPTDGEITKPGNADVFTHHGTSITVGTRSQSGARSATLSLAGLARRQEQQDRTPVRYVVSAVEPTFETDALFTESDQLTAALGGSTTSVADVVSGESAGDLTLTNGNGSTITYSLTDLDPQSYSDA